MSGSLGCSDCDFQIKNSKKVYRILVCSPTLPIGPSTFPKKKNCVQKRSAGLKSQNFQDSRRIVKNLCLDKKAYLCKERKLAMERNPYIDLAECLLPDEMIEYFEVVKVEKTSQTLDVTLEERDLGIEGYQSGELRPNGFYEESTVRDYPVRGRKMTFHVKRRRWVEVKTGKSVSKRWNLVAEGTRFSKEFAAFLKGMLGQIPDYGPLS